MTGIYTFGSSTPITRLIVVTPQSTPTKIVNTTLDGKDHIQTLANPVNRLSVEVQVDSVGRAILDELDATVGRVTVRSEGQTYHGYLLNKTPYSKPIRGQFRTSLVVTL